MKNTYTFDCVTPVSSYSCDDAKAFGLVRKLAHKRKRTSRGHLVSHHHYQSPILDSYKADVLPLYYLEADSLARGTLGHNGLASIPSCLYWSSCSLTALAMRVMVILPMFHLVAAGCAKSQEACTAVLYDVSSKNCLPVFRDVL